MRKFPIYNDKKHWFFGLDFFDLAWLDSFFENKCPGPAPKKLFAKTLENIPEIFRIRKQPVSRSGFKRGQRR